MSDNWTESEAWVAYFDIWGFKSFSENERIRKIDDAIKRLKELTKEFEENLEYLFFADTLVIYSKSKKINDYPALITISKRFYHDSIYSSLPMRGAISYGEIKVGHDKRILMGKASFDSHEYCEGQKWLGMILTPSASLELKKHGLKPERHGFKNYDVPMDKVKREFDNPLYAYCFNHGGNNFSSECPLLQPLREMMDEAKSSKDKEKYKRTIKFLEEHYSLFVKKITSSLDFD